MNDKNHYIIVAISVMAFFIVTVFLPAQVQGRKESEQTAEKDKGSYTQRHGEDRKASSEGHKEEWKSLKERHKAEEKEFKDRHKVEKQEQKEKHKAD